MFGKTNTPEWGNHCTTEPSLFGPTVNPWSPTITPGGSSGGSASAVAAGVVPAASGGDGTGSIRVPASCCGLVGLKPRRGRSSFAPDSGHSLEGLVNAHAVTRTVRDSAALLDVIAGSAPGDPYTAPPPVTKYLDAIAIFACGATYSDLDHVTVSGAAHRSRGGRRRRGKPESCWPVWATTSNRALPQSIPTPWPMRSRYCTRSATPTFTPWRPATWVASRQKTSSRRAHG